MEVRSDHVGVTSPASAAAEHQTFFLQDLHVGLVFFTHLLLVILTPSDVSAAEPQHFQTVGVWLPESRCGL